MKQIVRWLSCTLTVVTLLLVQDLKAQSILNPTDSVYTYDTTKPKGSVSNPNQPAWGTIAKWIRTVRLNWNTNEWKAYVYNSLPFRLKFPPDYNPTANDGKKYPLMIFFHGAGEAGPITDNEYSLANGGPVFTSAVDGGQFDGYVLVFQTPGDGWSDSYLDFEKQVADYMIANNKVDPFHIVANGLSAGGYATWGMMIKYPQYICTALPMSGIAIGDEDSIKNYKYTPVWYFQGGLDQTVDPNTAQEVVNAINAQGGNLKYTLYPQLGHGTWTTAWAEPDFWPWCMRQYASNPYTLFGRTAFCPGDNINVTIGVAPYYNQYQWRLNGTIIPGATGNSITATQIGTYDCRMLLGTNWSDWSHTPVVISIKQPTVTPPIQVNGLMSKVIPSLSSAGVSLKVPTGYVSYTWEKVGDTTTIGSDSSIYVTKPGQYIVKVTELYGCSSSFSTPFTVIDSAGPNKPDPASNVLVSTISQTSLELDWSQNPNPVYNETGFEIYSATKSGGPYTLAAITGQDVTTQVLTGLNSKTKYYFVIRAVDSTGASAVTKEVSGSTSADVQPPTSPGSLTILGMTRTSASLKWTSSTDNIGVTNYYIYVNGVKSYATTDTVFTINSLTPLQNYTFTVAATDKAGNISVKSNQVSSQARQIGLSYNYYTYDPSLTWNDLPDFGTLTPVSSGSMPNVSIANTTTTTNFSYLWQGTIRIPVSGTYTFQTNSDDGSKMWVGSLNQQSSPYTFSGAATVNNDGLHGAQNANSTPQYYAAGSYPVAIAYYQQGGGYSINVNWSTPSSGGNFVAIPDSIFTDPNTSGGVAPAAPTTIKATAVSYKQVNVTWTDNSNNETGFEVYRATSASGPFSIVVSTGPNVTSYADTALQPSTKYYYKVQAVNQYGASGFDAASMGGITYYYYQGSWNNLPNFSALTPVLTGVLPNISLSPSPTTTDFAFKFQGTIQIKTAGSYTFYTASDDGSNLYVGGFDSAHLIVKNDYLQGVTERSGTVTLAAGSYPFYVTYFQQGGGYSVTASYQGPGITKTLIPDSVFANPNPIATTLALPAAPATPYNMTATAVSSTSIHLGWADSATVNGYNVYRSIGDTTKFLLIANLPAGTVSYSDTGLYANQIYYYRVNAAWVGGVTANTSTASARALNVPPVITKLVSRNMRYGTSLSIPITVASSSGAVTFTETSLPGFGSFTATGGTTGTLTFTPTAANQGTFSNITVKATDIYGGADSTVFTLVVNSNYTPVVTAIHDTTVNENSSISIPLTATDSSTGKTLTWSYSNAPNTTTLVNNGNGSATLVVNPTYAAAGYYTVKVNINDGQGDSSTTSFHITVNNVDPTTKIYSRVQYATTMGAPWNNMTGVTTNNLKDANGNTTNVGINFLQSWWMPYNGGPTTGNNSGVYPDGVLSDFWYFGYYGGPETASLAVTGLNTTGKYNLTFFAASNFSGETDNGTTIYTVGTQSVSLYVQNNTKNTVSISNLSPDATGKITVNMQKAAGTPIGYLNALVVTQLYDDGTAPAGAGALAATNVPGKGVQLNWVDSAYNETGYNIYRSSGSTPTGFSLLTTVASGTTAYTDSLISGATQYYYTVQAVNTHGVSGYSDTAAILTTDRIPKITAIANVILKSDSTITIPVTAVDDSTDHLTLTATGLPSFASFTDNGNGTGSITIQPTSGVMGAFTGITVTATDLSDSARSTSFNLYVVDPNVSSTYVDITDYNYLAAAPWNNLAIPYLPYAGSAASSLTDDGGNQTGVTVTLTDAWDGVSETGMRLRNGSNVYPEAVERTAVYTTNTNNHRITVTGLSTSKTYNFLFFNSHGVSDNVKTNFNIGSQTVSLNGSYNSNKTVQINGVTTSTGTVVINVAKDSSAVYGMISALVIEAYNPAAVTTLSPSDLRVLDYSMTNKNSNSIALQWQDRANNETGYQVWRANDSGSNYALIASLPAGSTNYTDSNLAPNSNYYYTVRAVNGSNYSAYSAAVRGYTFATTVYINFNSAANAVGSPWNNLNWVYGIGSAWNNFTAETGVTTNLGMVQPIKVDGMVSPGVNTGNNSGIFPDKVMAEGFGMFPGDTTEVVLNGLDLAQTYELTVFASLTNYIGDNTTVYMINGQTCLLNSMNNKSGVLTIHGIVPDGNGTATLSFTGYPTSTFGLLGAMVVRGYSASANQVPSLPVTSKVNLMAVAATSSALMSSVDSVSIPGELKAFPNPFDQYFMLSVPAKGNDRVIAKLTDLSGHTVFEQVFDGLYSGDNELRVQPNAVLAPGVYVLTVTYNSTGETKTIKLLKH